MVAMLLLLLLVAFFLVEARLCVCDVFLQEAKGLGQLLDELIRLGVE